MDEKTIINYMKKKRYIEDKYICWDFVMDVYKDLYDIDLPEYPVTEVQAEFKIKLVSNINHMVYRMAKNKRVILLSFLCLQISMRAL